MKTFEDKSRESYNRIADDYDKTFDGKFIVKFKELLLEEITVENNSNILDEPVGTPLSLKCCPISIILKDMVLIFQKR